MPGSARQEVNESGRSFDRLEVSTAPVSLLRIVYAFTDSFGKL